MLLVDAFVRNSIWTLFGSIGPSINILFTLVSLKKSASILNLALAASLTANEVALGGIKFFVPNVYSWKEEKNYKVKFENT